MPFRIEKKQDFSSQQNFIKDKALKRKRSILMPLVNLFRKILLYRNCYSPIEINRLAQKYHEDSLLCDKKGNQDKRLEFEHKRDALREVLRQNVH